MRFNFGTDILNSSGEKVAELHQIVIDPATDQVTALIAKKGFLLPNDKVIPISLVMDSTDEYIKLYEKMLQRPLVNSHSDPVCTDESLEAG